MNLQIRDPRAHELARKLAERRGVSMTEAVIEALETRLEREENEASRASRLASIKAIADRLAAMSPGGGRDMTKDEIDEMWGHP